jgi:hypothetical protein
VRALVDRPLTESEEFGDQAVAVNQLIDRNEQGDSRDRQHPVRRVRTLTSIATSVGPPETEEDIRIKVQRTLLDLLRFSVLTNRLESIVETHSNTFEWVFDKDPSDKKWSSFPHWLAQGSGIYWVNGKEASGKSTLMKHIYNSPKTREHLEKWASPVSPITAAFFFWNSGTDLERSQEGLLRSLLYTVLSQQQSLIPVVLSRPWALTYSIITNQLSIEDAEAEGVRNELQSRNFLLRSFRKLIAQDLVPLKLFLLVDGLDEYSGDHEEISELFKALCTSPNVKAVVSSRPLLVFSNAFGTYPNLCLEELNHGDIRLYVSDKLEDNVLFKELAQSEPVGSAKLVEDLVTKSNGFFLWVVLVVRSLLHGLSNADRLSDLQSQLQTLPAALEDMYDHILKVIPEIFQVGASQILQIVLATRMIQTSLAHDSDGAEPLTLMDLALADGDPKESIAAKIQPWTDTAVLHRCRAMKTRLQARCSGLIEIRATNHQESVDIDPASRIQYSHRSVREYLQQENIHKYLLQQTANTTFSPYLSLLSSSVYHLKILDKPRSRGLLWHFVRMALSSAYQFESRNISPTYTSLLTQLDLTMSHHHQNLLKDDQGHWIEKTYFFKNIIQSDRGREAKQHGILHWSNFHPTQTQSAQTPPISQLIEWQSNYLALVIQFGLSKYLDQSLGTGDKILKSKKGRPLLDYAMSPLPGMEYDKITSEVVKVLLNHGANPNEKFEKKTCWTNALLWQHENFIRLAGRELGSLEQTRELVRIRRQILRLLIERGAKADACCRTEKGKIPATVMVTECFKTWDPDGLSNLLQLLAAQKTDVFKKLVRWT